MLMLFRRMGAALQKRQFGQMFYEFLLIFLAVMAGFAAENWRESLEDKKRLKQYLISMRNDLREDARLVSEMQPLLAQKLQDYTYVIAHLHGSPTDSQLIEMYVKARFAGRGFSLFQIRDQTYQQMKSAGDLRLVSHSTILDSIGKYYSFQVGGAYVPEEINYTHETEPDVFDSKAFFEVTKGATKAQLTPLLPAMRRKLKDEAACERYIHALQQVYGSWDLHSRSLVRLIRGNQRLETLLTAEIEKLE